MFKNFSVYLIAALVAASFMATDYAEITGSGFRHADCSGQLNINIWMDIDGDGLQGRFEESVPKAEVVLSLASAPNKGSERFTSTDTGSLQIGSLCRDEFLIEVDPETLPMGAFFDGAYEMGMLIVDGEVDGNIIIRLDNGSGRLHPGMRTIDLGFDAVTRGYKNSRN